MFLFNIYDLVGLLSALVIWGIIIPCFAKYPELGTRKMYGLENMEAVYYMFERHSKVIGDLKKTKNFSENNEHAPPDSTPEFSLSNSGGALMMDKDLTDVTILREIVHNVAVHNVD